MTTSTAHEVAVRLAGIADVTIVARLLERSNPPIDVDADGIPDGPANPTAAASVARMTLSHVVLQHGQIWVGERDERLLAAAVFVPPTLPSQRDELWGVVVRELGPEIRDDIDPGDAVRAVLSTAGPQLGEVIEDLDPDLLLIGLATADDVPGGAAASALRATVQAGLDALDEGRSAVAIALRDDRAGMLESLGFDDVATLPIGPDHRIWVGRFLRH